MPGSHQRYGAPGSAPIIKGRLDSGPIPVVTDEQRAKALALLVARDATDLADMLGLTPEETS
jgi:hypothetical protein